MTKLAQMVESVEDVLSATISLVEDLDETQGELPTGLEGWTVKDNLSHMVGLEQSLSGTAEPQLDVPEFGYIKNDFGTYMELHVHARRPLPMRAVLDELIGLLPRRMAQLRGWLAQGDPEVPGPLGKPRTLSDSLNLRVFDLWAHETDIRLAVGLEPRLDCFAAIHGEDIMFGAWARRLAASADASGELSVTCTTSGRSETIVLGEGEARASLTADRGVLSELGLGRGNVEEVLSRADVAGDSALIAAVTPHLAFTP